MTETGNKTNGGVVAVMNEDQWEGIDSRYRLIIVAAIRSKQLTRGATPRIQTDPRRHRSTSIALEEVKQGLVPFTIIEENKRGLAMRMGHHPE